MICNDVTNVTEKTRALIKNEKMKIIHYIFLAHEGKKFGYTVTPLQHLTNGLKWAFLCNGM